MSEKRCCISCGAAHETTHAVNCPAYIEDKNARIADLTQQIEALQWIPVSERLPDEFGWFLVVDGSIPHDFSVTMGFFEGAEYRVQWFPINSRVKNTMQITHWMPLPKPPTEQEG